MIAIERDALEWLVEYASERRAEREIYSDLPRYQRELAEVAGAIVQARTALARTEERVAEQLAAVVDDMLVAEVEQLVVAARTQEMVAEAVEARGYRAGWTAEQYVARQIAKAVEELAELARVTDWWDAPPTPEWYFELDIAAHTARDWFDAAGDDLVPALDLDIIRRELPDVLIPLLCLAEAVGLDLLALARAKAGADVARGVRVSDE